MVQIEDLSHPAVELKLPLDGGHHRYKIPQSMTLFFLGDGCCGDTGTNSTDPVAPWKSSLQQRDRGEGPNDVVNVNRR